METELRGKCYECYRPKKNCLCPYLDPFETNFHFCLLMHPKEAKKQPLGTGRLTKKALKNSQIVIDTQFESNKTVQDFLNSKKYSPYLLYPGKNSLNLSTETLQLTKKPVLFILDGTWPCAKSMLRDSPSLQNIPRISFDSQNTSRFLIKHQPAKYCLSTIESIYEVLTLLENQGHETIGNKKEQLHTVLDQMVQFQIRCANDPNLKSYKRKKSYKIPSERKQNLKWKKRNVCFLD